MCVPVSIQRKKKKNRKVTRVTFVDVLVFTVKFLKWWEEVVMWPQLPTEYSSSGRISSFLQIDDFVAIGSSFIDCKIIIMIIKVNVFACEYHYFSPNFCVCFFFGGGGLACSFVLERMKFPCGKGFKHDILSAEMVVQMRRGMPKNLKVCSRPIGIQLLACFVWTGSMSWQVWEMGINTLLLFCFVPNLNLLILAAVQNLDPGLWWPRTLAVLHLFSSSFQCAVLVPTWLTQRSISLLRRGFKCFNWGPSKTTLFDEVKASVWLWAHFYRLISTSCSSFHWMTGSITALSQAAVWRLLRWFVYTAVIHSSILIS